MAIYINDILITGQTEEEHLKALEEVLKRLAQCHSARTMLEQLQEAAFSHAELHIDCMYCVHCILYICLASGLQSSVVYPFDATVVHAIVLEVYIKCCVCAVE